ncbi:acetyl-CoA C-acetyltransferase [Halobacillus alkaliphilus]|uniref:Acetyl-CoA C-acetyltransferase n=1 Tax=Halobacillus alkaliphilus TaxID=396056 RepID=A0A1I2TJ79_9BACI|nr:glutaredoxin family protein [Halobacillus alkaliphilus]SFG64900.1 acetyl-CoA C-acetyltransferase [Halobacillus alkaliphilus]
MNEIILYTKQRCPLCEEVRSLVDLLSGEYQIEVEEIDIEQNEELMSKYLYEVPVLEVNGDELDYRSITYTSIEERLH